MKIQKELVTFEQGRSFKVFSPSLRDYFYWHYHAEIEIVYVEALNGIRHVGKHISGFVGSDLVLIGSNVPHLNFDYGIETEYGQIVVQLKDNFLQDIIMTTPEFNAIRLLLERAHLGLSFTGHTKIEVVKRLKELKDKNAFCSLIGLIDILQILSLSPEVEALNNEDTRVKWFLNDKVRMGTVYDYIHENYNKKPNVNDVAGMVSLSTAAFCRYFKRQTDITFTEFVNHYRINQAKTLLLHQASISEVCYTVGFESISYFNKLFKQLTSETPTAFKKKYTNKTDGNF